MFEQIERPELRRIYSADQLQYGKILVPGSDELLVPVICVDERALALEGLRAFRMQGFANYEAVHMTLEQNVVTFWSRSQGGIWTKGVTSGNVLQLRAAYTDCDSDSLLLDVNPIGPTCHTGARSCFEVPNIGE